MLCYYYLLVVRRIHFLTDQKKANIGAKREVTLYV